MSGHDIQDPNPYGVPTGYVPRPFNPFTGQPRHPADVASDPKGVLIHHPSEPLRAAAPAAEKPSALAVQVGGGHYAKRAIQPVEYCHANNIPFMEGSVIKYVTRWRDKGGVQDLQKAKHFLELLIEMEERKR